MATISGFRSTAQCCYCILTICHCRVLHQRTFTYVRAVGSIYSRLDSYQRTKFSTSSANSTRGDSRVQKFRKVVDTFVAGSKQLGKDVKLMFAIQRKLQNNNYNWEILKTEEIIHLHQVCAHLYFVKLNYFKFF